MTRKIEFKGRLKSDGSWIYGDLIHDNHGGYYIYPIDSMCLSLENEVDQDTVGQFTGLRDKNYRKIYEGDIVKNRLSKNIFGVVTWHTDGYFFFDTSNGEWKKWNDEYRPVGEMLRLRCDGKSFDFEVIGNIHDYPELLDRIVL